MNPSVLAVELVERYAQIWYLPLLMLMQIEGRNIYMSSELMKGNQALAEVPVRAGCSF